MGELAGGLGSEFLFEIRRGNHPKLAIVGFRGKNPDIDTANSEDIIPWGGLYVFRGIAESMEVVSTSAADAAAGTGLRTALVIGLDNSFAEISETVILNGLTPVPLVNQYIRINGFVGITAGVNAINAGTIDLRTTVGSIIQAQMPPGESSSRHAVYTVPAGKRFYGHSATIDIRKSTADDIEVLFMIRKLPPLQTDGALVSLTDISVQGQGTSTFYWPFTYGGSDGPADLLIRGVNGGANNIGLVVVVNGILEDIS